MDPLVRRLELIEPITWLTFAPLVRRLELIEPITWLTLVLTEDTTESKFICAQTQADPLARTRRLVPLIMGKGKDLNKRTRRRATSKPPKLTADQKYICEAMGTKLPLLPVHGEAECRLFSQLIGEVLAGEPDFDQMAISWYVPSPAFRVPTASPRRRPSNDTSRPPHPQVRPRRRQGDLSEAARLPTDALHSVAAQQARS